MELSSSDIKPKPKPKAKPVAKPKPKSKKNASTPPMPDLPPPPPGPGPSPGVSVNVKPETEPVRRMAPKGKAAKRVPKTGTVELPVGLDTFDFSNRKEITVSVPRSPLLLQEMPDADANDRASSLPGVGVMSIAEFMSQPTHVNRSGRLLKFSRKEAAAKNEIYYSLPRPDYTDINWNGPMRSVTLPGTNTVVDVPIPFHEMTLKDKALFRPEREHLARYAYRYLLDAGIPPFGIQPNILVDFVQEYLSMHGYSRSVKRPVAYDHETVSYTRNYRYATPNDGTPRDGVVAIFKNGTFVFPFVITDTFIENNAQYRRMLAQVAIDHDVANELATFLDLTIEELVEGVVSV